MSGKRKEQFFWDEGLPFVELRRSQASSRSFRPHMHRTFSIGCVESGEVLFEVGGKPGILRPGSLVLVNPEVLHACNSLTQKGRSYSMLYLDVSWGLKVQQMLWKGDVFIPVGDVQLDDEKLYNRFLSLVSLLGCESVHRCEKEEEMVVFCRDLFERSCQPFQQESPIREGAEVSMLRKLLSEDLDQDLTLDSLADRLGCNPYTLLRHFKAQTGITPHAYRMNCRVELAKRYLSQGREIADVAVSCGFFDQSHLHRFFKAMTTVTPREYRLNFVQ